VEKRCIATLGRKLQGYLEADIITCRISIGLAHSLPAIRVSTLIPSEEQSCTPHLRILCLVFYQTHRSNAEQTRRRTQRGWRSHCSPVSSGSFLDGSKGLRYIGKCAAQCQTMTSSISQESFDLVHFRCTVVDNTTVNVWKGKQRTFPNCPRAELVRLGFLETVNHPVCASVRSSLEVVRHWRWCDIGWLSSNSQRLLPKTVPPVTVEICTAHEHRSRTGPTSQISCVI